MRSQLSEVDIMTQCIFWIWPAMMKVVSFLLFILSLFYSHQNAVPKFSLLSIISIIIINAE